MKRNKIAAGALALAMGLSAVAPSFAAEAPKADTKAEYTYDYKVAKENFVKEWNKLRAAEQKLEGAKAVEATAQANYEQALDKLAELEARYGDQAGVYDGSKYQADLDRVNDEKQAAIEKYEGNISSDFENKPNYQYLTNKYIDNLSQYIDESVNGPAQEAQAEALKDIIALNDRVKVLNDELKGVEDRRSELQSEVSRRLGDYNEAKNKRQEAEKAVNTAQESYDSAKVKLIGEGVSVDVINKAEKSGDITVVTDEAPAKDDNKAPTQAELDALRESVNEAKATIKAVEIVRSKATKISDKNKDYLDKLVAEAEKLVTKGEAVLKANEKKAAFSVFSTAYAAEEEEETPASSEDVKELTDQLNRKTEEMKKAIEDVDAEEDPAEEEEKPADKEEEKPADKDEEEKPADKEEEKTPAKEEEKPAVKEDTTAKSAVKSSANRTAGRNAKTGIAGVAGVAGVLAAASVAYAASKKNN